MLKKSFVEKYKNRKIPWGELGYLTYKRTYARSLGNRMEEWHETVERCVNGILDLGADVNGNTLFDYVFNFKCNFGGRHLWQLGTDTIRKVGADSLQNCWHVACDTPDAFMFAFNELMLGGGVGFNITSQYVYNLPTIKPVYKIREEDSFDVDYIVADNREGWVRLLKKVIKAYYVTGKEFTYSTKCVRSAGKPIKSFGGTASGPRELVKGIQKICKIFDSRVEEKLRPVDVLDIMNLIGGIVVSGNVRRSAQIALGDYNDIEFLKAKRWDLGDIPNHRTMSNNSVISEDMNLPEAFWEPYEIGGEPYGLINLHNCRHYGRMADEQDYRPDLKVTGVNPCAEVALESFESCNLAEIYLPNLNSYEEFRTAAELMYKVCKTIANQEFSDYRTNEIVHRNQRIGLGITGYYGSKFMNNPGIFQMVYQYLENLDVEYSKVHGVNESIKLTTVKPSGTLSLLPKNIPPGAHPAYAPYYIRRIRLSADSPLVAVCSDYGYNTVPEQLSDGSLSSNTAVVSIPVDNSRCVTAKEIGPIEQLETQQFLQDYWADNSVSSTIYYHKGDLPEIKKYLELNYGRMKAVSFLQHNEHGFTQAPLEEITKQQYKEMCLPPLTKIDTKYYEEDLSGDCDAGNCPIR